MVSDDKGCPEIWRDHYRHHDYPLQDRDDLQWYSGVDRFTVDRRIDVTAGYWEGK